MIIIFIFYVYFYLFYLFIVINFIIINDILIVSHCINISIVKIASAGIIFVKNINRIISKIITINIKIINVIRPIKIIVIRNII